MPSPTTKRIVWILLLCIAIPIVPFAIIGELPGERWLQAQGDSALAFGATGAALLAADVLLPVPSSILGSLLGARLGFAAGFAWTFAGLMLGHLVGYGMGRVMFSKQSGALPNEPAALALVLSRPVPVLAEALTFAAGASKLRFSTLLLTLSLGNGIYALALAGSGAAWLPEGWAGPGLVVPLSLPVVGWLIWKWRVRRGPAPSKDVDASAPQ